MANSWFVGTDEQGIVTIYRGIPESIGGLDLREEEERGSVSLSQVPEYLRDDVERGIRADSLAEARRTLSNIEERSRDFGGTPEPQQTP
jgi:protein phosphatase